MPSAHHSGLTTICIRATSSLDLPNTFPNIGVLVIKLLIDVFFCARSIFCRFIVFLSTSTVNELIPVLICLIKSLIVFSPSLVSMVTFPASCAKVVSFFMSSVSWRLRIISFSSAVRDHAVESCNESSLKYWSGAMVIIYKE